MGFGHVCHSSSIWALVKACIRGGVVTGPYGGSSAWRWPLGRRFLLGKASSTGEVSPGGTYCHFGTAAGPADGMNQRTLQLHGVEYAEPKQARLLYAQSRIGDILSLSPPEVFKPIAL